MSKAKVGLDSVINGRRPKSFHINTLFQHMAMALP